MITKCPFCGSRIELSVVRWYHIDSDGELEDDFHLGCGDVKVYCANDCQEWSRHGDHDGPEGEPTTENIQELLAFVLEGA